MFCPLSVTTYIVSHRTPNVPVFMEPLLHASHQLFDIARVVQKGNLRVQTCFEILIYCVFVSQGCHIGNTERLIKNYFYFLPFVTHDKIMVNFT